MTDPGDVCAPFLDAAHAVAVIEQPEIGAAWDRPSSLPRMTVGDVAGPRSSCCGASSSTSTRPSNRSHPRRRAGAAGPTRADTEADLDVDVHVMVRDDGHHVAEWGWADVVGACRDRVATLERWLPDGAPDHAMLGGVAVPFADYLASRVVELLVHADDLATSVGIDLPEPPTPAVDLALATLLRASRDAHGDFAVLRAFTRRERVPPGAPAVY